MTSRDVKNVLLNSDSWETDETGPNLERMKDRCEKVVRLRAASVAPEGDAEGGGWNRITENIDWLARRAVKRRVFSTDHTVVESSSVS